MAVVLLHHFRTLEGILLVITHWDFFISEISLTPHLAEVVFLSVLGTFAGLASTLPLLSPLAARFLRPPGRTTVGDRSLTGAPFLGLCPTALTVTLFSVDAPRIVLFDDVFAFEGLFSLFIGDTEPRVT